MKLARVVLGLGITLCAAAPAALASTAEPGGVNPLEFKGDLAIWTLAVFLVLLAILWRFAWGPLMQGIEKREQRVADQIAQAQQANRQAQDLLAQHEQKLLHAQAEVRGILDEARRDAEQLGRELVERAKTDAEAEHQRALRQIETATTAALKELADRSAALAVELAGKIVRARLSPHDHARLIEQAMAGFAGKEPNEN